jgi:imidazole glycerol-phosphate synthase subunit HisF
MIRRIIPILLLREDSLVKTKQFKDPVYIGDPLNAIKIFNEKLVDEIIVLDTLAAVKKSTIQYDFLKEMAGECFMPLSYGGGVNTIEDIRKVLQTGIEKVIITTAAADNPGFIKEASERFGSSTIVVGIDYKRDILGRIRVMVKGGTKSAGTDPITFARMAEDQGAGEIVLQSIDRDGTQNGYDLDMLEKILIEVNIPVIVSGGAGKLQHLKEAIHLGASAVAAGSLFVFRGTREAIIISYPRQEDDRYYR